MRNGDLMCNNSQYIDIDNRTRQMSVTSYMSQRVNENKGKMHCPGVCNNKYRVNLPKMCDTNHLRMIKPFPEIEIRHRHSNSG